MAGKPKQVSEREARGDVERVLYEMKQTLRVTGLDVTVRTWAGFERFLVGMWEGMEPNAGARAFEAAADEVRAQAVGAVEAWERLGTWEAVELGESQRYQLRAAIELYHDMNAKMLVLTSAVRQALGGELAGSEQEATERLERGAPPRMPAMEWVSERPDDLRLRALFKDILKAVGPPSLPGEYRALALWPHYLSAAWERLEPWMGREVYVRAREELLRTARRLARELPYRVDLSGLVEPGGQVARVTEQFERRLPALVLNVALLAWDLPEVELRRPFPSETRWEEAAAGGLQ
jgi:hypothetical protein